MKVAVSSNGPSLEAVIDHRFGRCIFFVIVDTDTMQFESIQNTSQYMAHGAGIQAAQIIADKNIKIVLTGNVGPNAYQALSATGIQIVTGASGTIREAVQQFKKGELKGTTSPTTPLHYGVGGGGSGMSMVRGRRTGGGRGMGRSMMSFSQQQYPGTQTPPPTPTTSPKMTKKQEVQILKNQLNLLQDQLEQIKKRLENIEK